MNLKDIWKKAENFSLCKNTCRITVVSNITLDPYLTPFLKISFSKLNISADIHIIRLENYLNEIDIIKSSNLIAVLPNFEYEFPDWYNNILSKKFTLEQLKAHIIKECKAVYRTLKSNTSNPIMWFGYENEEFYRTSVCGFVSTGTKIIDSINADVCSFLSENDSHIDLKHLISNIGIPNAYNNKGKYRWNAPYSRELIQGISNEICKQYMIQNGITKKCLVLDCDGVLWGGVLSEDGIGQIKLGNEGLGRPYQDFQRFLLTLYYHGVILAICSKNDFTDVIQVFRKHSGMILKEEHIGCFRVSWDSKPESIRKIAETLNIGLDSIVFVDDTKYEVEAVRWFLPEVLSIQYDRNNIYESLSCFNLKNQVNIEQIVKRNLTYQTNASRKKLRSQSADFDSYIAALEVRVNICRSVSSELTRIAELTQRTNQCTNGIRYSTVEVLELLKNPSYCLYSVYVSDKFSNLGLVGTIGIDGLTLDLFSLSCRALDRNVEDEMMKIIIDSNVKNYRFSSTGKNERIGNLFASKWNLE